MKLGFFLRRMVTFSQNKLRDFLDITYYLFWLLIDPSKFMIIRKKNIKNILVIYGAETVGDTHTVLGIINSLIEENPYLIVSYLTAESSRKYIKNPKINLPTLQDTKKMIDEKRFDALILLSAIPFDTEIFDKQLFLKILKIPYRISCDRIQKLNLFKYPLMLSTRRIGGGRNWQDFLKCFKRLGFHIKKPKFYSENDGKEYIRKFFKKYKIDKKEKLILFHPGGGSITHALEQNLIPSHLWPEENWANVADYIISNYNARIIFTGTGKEAMIVNKIIAKIKNKNKIINLVNKNSIEESFFLMNNSELLITIDTGTPHIAAQTKIPMIDLFASFNPRLSTPIGNKCKIMFHPEVCNNCKKYYCPEGNNVCMKAITVSEIIEEVKKILGKTIF